MIARLITATGGAAAVELAIALPVVIVLLSGVGEFGQAMVQRERMQAAVNAGIELALQGADQANDTGGTTLASTVAQLVRDHASGGNGTATVTVNNGATATAQAAGGSPSISGTAANAAQCYCLTGTASLPVWGSPLACGNSCPGSATAGRYVTATLVQSRTPLFPGWYAMPGPTTLRVAAAVRVG